MGQRAYSLSSTVSELSCLKMLWIEMTILSLITVNSAQSPDQPPVISSDVFPGMPHLLGQSYLSLLLLALTVGLSGGVYLCLLRYICIGCCQPVLVGPEDENLSGVV